MDSLLEDLQALLGRVSEDLAALPSGAVQCGSCTKCCHAGAITAHNVSELEYALLAERISPLAALQFRQFVERQTDDQGGLLHLKCPHLSEPAGCQVYQVRPYSCRVFGHIRNRQSRLPDDCFYEGHEKVIDRQDYYREVPGSAELRKLWREFQLHLPMPAAGTGSEGKESQLNLDDPLDRVWQHLGVQRFEDALRELQSLDHATSTPARCELWAITLAGLGRHQEALAKYQELASFVPPRADLLFQAGCSAFMLGDLGASERFWKNSLQLEPAYGPSLHMLGYLSQLGSP